MSPYDVTIRRHVLSLLEQSDSFVYGGGGGGGVAVQHRWKGRKWHVSHSNVTNRPPITLHPLDILYSPPSVWNPRTHYLYHNFAHKTTYMVYVVIRCYKCRMNSKMPRNVHPGGISVTLNFHFTTNHNVIVIQRCIVHCFTFMSSEIIFYLHLNSQWLLSDLVIVENV